MTPSQEERELTKRLQRGDSQAFEAIYWANYQSLHNSIRRYTRNRDETLDVLQLVFVSLWEHRERLDPDLPVAAYLNRLARNWALKHLRQKLTAAKHEADAPIGMFTIAADEDIIDQENQALLNAAIAALPSQRRLIFTMRREQGLSNAEIATELGISKRTVEDQMMKALRMLRGKLLPVGVHAIGLLQIWETIY